MSTLDERAEAAWEEYLEGDDYTFPYSISHQSLCSWAHKMYITGFKARDSEPSETDRLLKEAAELMRCLNRHPSQRWQVEFLCDEVHLSRWAVREIIDDGTCKVAIRPTLVDVIDELRKAGPPKPTREGVLADCKKEIALIEDPPLRAHDSIELSLDRLRRIEQFLEELEGGE